MTVGLLIGVTLVMTFAVAMTTYKDVLLRILPPDDAGEVIRATSQVVNITITVFSVLIGVSAIIAAIGLVNILSLTVGQRRREIALLRAIGFSRAQVRRMILAESGALVAGGTVLGLILGTGFGWAGGLALTGSLTSERRSMHDVGPIFVWPSMPWALCALIVLAAVVLTLAAAALPIRRAVATTPVEALQVT